MKNTTMLKKYGMIFLLMLSVIFLVTACTNSGNGTTGNSAYNPPSSNIPLSSNNAGTPSGGVETQTNYNGSTATNVSVSTNTVPATNRVKLSDSNYARVSYLISDDQMDAQTLTAMAGFNRTITRNVDGTTTIVLTSTNPEYTDQTYTLQPGEKLYFIERALGDDSDNNEGNLGDDKAIIVDADGYIVQ